MKTPHRRDATLDAGGAMATVQHRAGDLLVACREAELTGRDAERRVLDRLVEGLRAGESRALVVHGEPGAGKTALLEYLGRSAPGCRIEQAAGVSSWRWSWPLPGCISCARRCWIGWRRCRCRSVRRCGPRSA
jgi:AAA ATPase domain